MAKYYVIKYGGILGEFEDYAEADKLARKTFGEIATEEPTKESKESILENIGVVKPTTARNIMGCNESWYDTYYAMREVFSPEELKAMSEEELNHLLRLGNAISDALY